MTIALLILGGVFAALGAIASDRLTWAARDRADIARRDQLVDEGLTLTEADFLIGRFG